MEQKSLKDLILEHLENKGLNLDKAVQATGVPKHYLEAILAGNWKKLPAAPYVRGYFKKLEGVLDLQPNQLWQIYQDETEIQTSGASDLLPENRFAIRSVNKKWIWPALAAVLVAIYLLVNLSHLLGRPDIRVSNPLAASVVTSLPNFIMEGTVDPSDKLSVNNEEVFVDKSGKFQENYNLQPGLNTFEFIAKRFLGQETKVVKQIIYQPNQNQKNDVSK